MSSWVYSYNSYFYKNLQIKVMKKYYSTIPPILFFVFGLLSCSNEETTTQTPVAARPTVPIQNGEVQIGTQIWMTKNLNVSRYRNGDPIPQVTDQTQWENLTTGAWCYYNNDPTNGPIYGKLYNWYAVNDPRGLAPNSWHVPCDEEWTILINFLGGEGEAGGKMKATGILKGGTGLWISPNFEGTNSSGFSGLPGGNRYYVPLSFFSSNIAGYWWSSSEYDGFLYAWSRYVDSYNSIVFRDFYSNSIGCSVRCVKN
jgi:uncharacterized protein (TIGR02145 family)